MNLLDTVSARAYLPQPAPADVSLDMPHDLAMLFGFAPPYPIPGQRSTPRINYVFRERPEREALILGLAAQQEITTADVIELGIRKNTAEKDLKRLTEQGKLRVDVHRDGCIRMNIYRRNDQ